MPGAPEPNSPPPPRPEDEESARQWLAWARSHSHQPGCLCHGCIRARALLFDQLPTDE